LNVQGGFYVKALRHIFGFLFVLPLLLLNRLKVLTVYGASVLLGHVPLGPGRWLRGAYFRRVIDTCEDGSALGPGLEIKFQDPRNLHIHKGARLLGETKIGEALATLMRSDSGRNLWSIRGAG